MKIENLPSHEECGEAVSSDLATPLHQFIYDNEPAGREEGKAFRIGLVNALNEHTKNEICEIKILNGIIGASRVEPGTEKPFTVSVIRDLEKMVTVGDITYSRMVELMNERAFNFFKEKKS